MKFWNNIITLLGILIYTSNVCVSQSLSSADTLKNGKDTIHSFNPIVDNIVDYIPPLSVLIDSALENSYLLKSKYAELQMSNCNLASKRIDYTKFFSANLSYSYGNQQSILNNELALINTRSTSSNWGVGVAVKVPLNSILDYKNQIKNERYNYEKIYYDYSSLRQQVRLEIIDKYNELIFIQKTMQFKHTSMIDFLVQLKMAELQFKDAQISISVLSSMRIESTKTQFEFEQIKHQFINSYYTLQELVGYNFNLLKANF